MNSCVLVGRLLKEPVIEEDCTFEIIVKRPYINKDGIYEDDLIPCRVDKNLAKRVCEYCHKYDVVGIKGRIQNNNNKIELVVDKMTFLSSNKKEEENGKARREEE